MAGETLCLQELDFLKEISNSLKILTGPNSEFRGTIGNWSYRKVGRSWFFEQVVTYAGATQSIDVDFPNAIQLNRIEQVCNDATARDFSVRVFTDPALAYYIELDNQAANTALNRVIQAGAEYKYPAGSRLRLYYSNFTVGKTVTIRVQVDEL